MPVIIGGGQFRGFEVDMNSQDVKETAKYVFDVIKDMTKSHFELISCETLEKLIEADNSMFVYFGSEESMKED